MPLSLGWTVTGIFASFVPFIAGPNNFQFFLSSHLFRQTDLSTDTLTTPNVNSCITLQTTLPTLLLSSNTSISSITHVVANSTIQTAGSCTSKAYVSSDICRVVGQVNTTESSRVKFEMWLPMKEEAEGWYGRVLTVGNGGLNGCIDYGNLDYGSSFHFATIACDNGHDGVGGLPFLDSPEIINDFAWRSIRTIAQLSRVIAARYYSPPSDIPLRSYYIGCSTGGRQGIQSALKFPEDFDGILAGAPAVDMQHLLGWSGMISRTVGAGSGRGRESAQFIDEDGWDLVSEEVLRQCDALDGNMDGIVTEPEECQFDPGVLLCGEESEEDVEGEGNIKEGGCLTEAQVDALKKIYSPLVGRDGETVLYPRFDPGAEGIPMRNRVFAPEIFFYTFDWWRYAIYNDSSRTLDDFGLNDIEFADSINPGGVATWDGDLSRFRERGGKILTYHGRMDPLIASGNSKRLYNLVSSTLSDVSNALNTSSIEDFYRLFLIPGMSHCTGGPGASHFGQRGPSALGTAHNDSDHNALLALVEWVEGGRAPEVIIGTEDGDDGKVREHCRWPGWRSVWRGSEGEDGGWVCEETHDSP